ncbi:MAG: RNA-binding protein [Anaerolineales bacterium]
MQAKLYVWNMSENTIEDDLQKLFEQVGPVATAEIVKDEKTGKNTGLGFVTMESKDDAAQAITKFNDYPLNGRDLVVSFHRPDEDRKVDFAATAYDPDSEQE